MPTVAIPGAASAPELSAHLAVPPVGVGPWPAVVVLHEAFGLTDDVRQQADRLSAAGYLAVAPDLYTAGGPLRCLKKTFSALSRGAGPAVDDIEAVRSWVAARPDCTGRVGVLGFCQGGGFALLMAARGFDAAAPNYGPLPKDARTVLAGACPIVASYGAKDRAFGRTAAELEDVLTGLGIDHDVKQYPGAGHSFLNRHNAGPLFSVLERVAGLSYHEPSAQDAWARILVFFDQHLRA
jgi:carboxymethylenebutenolidase